MSGQDIPDTWVQCEWCDKWRKLRHASEPLPEHWYCELNPVANFASCEAPEESQGIDEKGDVAATLSEADQEAEVCRLAAAEGLTLQPSDNSAGFKGVKFDSRSGIRPYRAEVRRGLRKTASLGQEHTESI